MHFHAVHSLVHAVYIIRWSSTQHSCKTRNPGLEIVVQVGIPSRDGTVRYGDYDEIAYFSAHWKSRKEELKPISRVKTENGPISLGSQSGVSMVRQDNARSRT